VGSVGVVVDAPVLGQGLGLKKRREGLDIQQLIAQQVFAPIRLQQGPLSNDASQKSCSTTSIFGEFTHPRPKDPSMWTRQLRSLTWAP
jgi:hypothetical protein